MILGQAILPVSAVFAALYLCILPFEGLTALKNTCLLLACVGASLNAQKQTFTSLPIRHAFLLWLLAACMTLPWSIDPAASLNAIWREIIKTGLVYTTCYLVAQQRLSPGFFAYFFPLSALAFSGLAVHEIHTYDLWQGPHTPPRYDIAVSTLSLTAMLFPYLLRKYQPQISWTLRLAAWVALLVSLNAGVLSLSRSYTLALSLDLAFVIAFATPSRGKFIALKLALIASAVILPLKFFKGPRQITYISDREVLYEKVWESIKLHPWTGTGFGHETHQAWYKETFGNSLQWSHLTSATHAHNIALSYMEQLGIIAGLLTLVVLFVSLARPFLMAMRHTEPETQALGQAGFLLAIGVLVSNSFNYYFTRNHLWLFMGFCGLLHGWIQLKTSSGTTDPAKLSALPERKDP